MKGLGKIFLITFLVYMGLHMASEVIGRDNPLTERQKILLAK